MKGPLTVLSHPPDVTFVTTGNGREMHLHPSGKSAAMWTAMFVWGGFASLGWAGYVWLTADKKFQFSFHTNIVVLVVSLFGVGMFGVAAWNWQLRKRPLVVEESGRVSYGRKELCAPAAARGMQILTETSGDSNTYGVAINLTKGGSAQLPAPYFAIFSSKSEARALAEIIAGFLKIHIAD